MSPDSTKPFPFFLKGNGFGVAWHANLSSSRRAPKNGVLRALPPFSPRESRRRPSVFATVAVVIAEGAKRGANVVLDGRAHGAWRIRE